MRSDGFFAAGRLETARTSSRKNALITAPLAPAFAPQILVVGHGGIQTVMLKDLCPGIDVGWLRDTHWDNCAFAEIDLVRHEDGQLSGDLLAWNQHSHLHGRAADLVPGIPQDE